MNTTEWKDSFIEDMEIASTQELSIFLVLVFIEAEAVSEI